MSKPTDEEIIQALTAHGRCMTYVLTNILRRKYWPLNTAYILRRLKKLEAAGKVMRVRSSYAVQICWEAAR
ncbi:hypothetical protein ASV07_14750 [Enterobacter roggenkampii]|nr:hypothetical protein ASV07_14750 [Enterobacter roggenkampii]